MIRLAAIVTRTRLEPTVEERAFWALIEGIHPHTFLATATTGVYCCSRPGCGKTMRRIPG